MTEAFDIGRRSALKAGLAAALAAAAPRMALAQDAGAGQRLVVFLSRSGNTRVLAGALARRYGADLFELRPHDPWPENYEEMVAWARALSASDVDVPLAETLPGIDGYQTVFLGFPVWSTDLPAVTRSFLRSHDLSGKTVVPFITYGSSGAGSSMRTVRALAPDAQFGRRIRSVTCWRIRRLPASPTGPCPGRGTGTTPRCDWMASPRCCPITATSTLRLS
jgi:flavodoxin